MWLFTKYGVLSVSYDRNTDTYHVRSRSRRTLIMLRRLTMLRCPIRTRAGVEYPYRMIVDKDVLRALLETLVRNLDYQSLKDEVADTDLEEMYWRVWLETKRPSAKGNDSSP